MALQERDNLARMMIADDDDDDDDDAVGCDESKCVSRGKSNEFNNSFTCYGTTYNSVNQMMCADGFMPFVLEAEPVELQQYFVGGRRWQHNVSYHTCCPPDWIGTNATAAATRQCSDPISFANPFDLQDDSICDAHAQKYPHQKYPRRMKKRKHRIMDTPFVTDSFVCCDSPTSSGNGDTSFIEESECVPYRDDYHEAFRSGNYIGMLQVISCDFSDDSFMVPRPLDGQPFPGRGYYQCCRSGTPVGPFIKDDKFKITVYPQLALYGMAAVASATIFIALLIPLFLSFKNKSDSRTRRSRKNKPSYSTYNLYVLYLALFDLIYCLFQIGKYWSMVDQKFNPNFTFYVWWSNHLYGNWILYTPELIINFAYININIMINAAVSYRLLLLLQKSRNAQRTESPSLRRVSIEVGIVFLHSMAYAGILSAFQYFSVKAEHAGDGRQFNKISIATYVVLMIHLLVPVIFVCGIVFRIWWRGYLPSANRKSSARNIGIRQLYFFFLRIIVIFFVIVIAMISFLLVKRFISRIGIQPSLVLSIVSQTMTALQPILSACMVMTKYDSRKYVWDLISLSYCRSVKNKETSNKFYQVYNRANHQDDGHGESLSHTGYTETTRSGTQCTETARSGSAFFTNACRTYNTSRSYGLSCGFDANSTSTSHFGTDITQGQKEQHLGKNKTHQTNHVTVAMSGQILTPGSTDGRDKTAECDDDDDDDDSSDDDSDSDGLRFSIFGHTKNDVIDPNLVEANAAAHGRDSIDVVIPEISCEAEVETEQAGIIDDV